MKTYHQELLAAMTINRQQQRTAEQAGHFEAGKGFDSPGAIVSDLHRHAYELERELNRASSDKRKKDSQLLLKSLVEVGVKAQRLAEQLGVVEVDK